MTTPVPPSAIGQPAFTPKYVLSCSPTLLPPNEQAAWVAARSSWPRILTPSLVDQIESCNREDAEPRWCKAWTTLYNVLSTREWRMLKWLDRCDYYRLMELGNELMSKPWKFLFTAERAEWIETDDRITARYRDCVALSYLWSRYVTYEADRGVHNVEAVLARLQPFDEDETPSYAEREERARKVAAVE